MRYSPSPTITFKEYMFTVFYLILISTKFQLSTSVTCMYHTDFGSLTQLKTFKLLRTNVKLFVNFHTLEIFRLPFSPSG